MIRLTPSLWRCRLGSASIELVLVTPMILILMFGLVDLGNYFMSQHVVVKAVRDGARYASRRGFGEYTGCSTVSSDVDDPTKEITRTGTLAPDAPARLANWTDSDTTIFVTVRCDTSGTYASIYKGQAGGVPVVKVRAVVPYNSLFRHFGITTATIDLTASSEVPVMGI